MATANPINGTISATGTYGPVVGRKVSIKMKFSGVASIDVEEQLPSGAWVKIDPGITADYRKVFDSPTNSAIRLNCTAWTNSVEYSLEVGQ